MLHLIVTAHCNGDFAYFPRLQTAIGQLRGKLEGKILLLDSGRAWSDESWVCQVTENRAPYMVMDAMGYAAVFADGLTPEIYAILAPQILMNLTDDIRGYPIKHEDEMLIVRRHRQPEAVLMDGELKLPMPPAYGLYQISLEENPWRVVEQIWHEFPPTTPPNSTIAGMVDFVVGEARYYRQQQARQNKKP